MISYIKGIMDYIDQNLGYVVVEAGGIGYKIYTSASSIKNLPAIGTEVKIYTNLHVREEVMDLYGFITREELSMFELLISVSGIGCKVALSILSSSTPSEFALAIITSDVSALTKAQGIGNKIAQRVILELKDKMKSQSILGALNTVYNGQYGQKSDAGITSDVRNARIVHSDAVNALTVLGYSAAEAATALKDIDVANMKVEDVIKQALKRL